ncbi:MAG: PD40 domain-containing protein [Gemmatirosa sp.]|nr:PD40 domain-containing protein [Gemmatirosa sp.]
MSSCRFAAPLLAAACLGAPLGAPLGAQPFTAATAPAPPGDPAAGTRLLRQPTVSATQIAFAHGGDLWIVGRDGGDARRLTSFPGVESFPRFSPDGKTVAFTGEYGGNQDVYVVPAEGGEPTRLTWHPGADLVRGWSPDGKQVLFTSGRTSAPTAVPKLWAVPVAGGLETPLPIPRLYKGGYSADGRRIAYQAISPNDVEWRNYRGGQAQPIRVLDVADLSMTKLPWSGSNDTDPVWLGDRIYFLSDRDDAVNLYGYSPATKQVAQLTHFRDFDAKALDAGGGPNGALVYEQGGYIHLYDPAAGRDRQLVITTRGDQPWAQPQWKDVSRLILRGSLSPTGARALFEARGEVFTVPVEKGDWRNLTRSSNAADRYPAWSPDGQKIAWFSDAGGEYALMIGTQDGSGTPRTIKLEKPTYYFAPTWSPDSRYLAFTDEGLNLWYVDVATGTPHKVDTDPYMVPARTVNPVWSPDSKWIAYAKRLPSQYHVVMVHSLADGRSRQLTDGMSDAVSPAWDASGRYLYFLASTNYALNTGWLEMSNTDRPVTRAIYFAVLRADDPSPLLPESDEEAAPRPTPTPADTTRPAARTGTGAPVSPQAARGDSTRPNAAAAPAVRIDWDNVGQRILSLDVPARDYQSLVAGPAGVVFYSESVPNQPGVTLHRYDVKKRAAAPYLTGINSYALSANGKKLLYSAPNGPPTAGQQWGVLDSDKPGKVGDGRLRTDLRALVDPRQEWPQIFKEAWRLERDFFYVKNMHGAKWDDVYRMYAPWVDHVAHRSDLTYLLDILGGELSVGHSFVTEGDVPATEPVPIGLLGADLEESQGRYRIARIYTGENWNPDLRAPLSAPGIRVAPGDYILAVNGVELRAPTNPYRLFEGTVNRQTVLRINDRPTMDGARDVTVVPIASETALRSRAWVEDNRRTVDKLSNGRLAYVYLPNTAGAGYTYFNRYYFAQQQKQGAVIDERFNGGGQAADYIVETMRRQLYGYFNNPVGDRTLFTTPQAGIWGPKVLLINESAGSGGDLLPFMFREAKVGPLVGTRTWGGLVGIWDGQPLVDGGSITNPRGGFINLAGEWDVENKGVPPDIEVEITPKDAATGHDPQLERGVQEALRLLDANPPKLVAREPAAPIRSKRPGGR